MRTFTITALVATVSASSWTENDGFACAGRNEIDLQDPKSVDGAKAACAANSDCVSFEVLPDGRFQGSSSCTMQVGATAYPGYQLWIKSAAPAKKVTTAAARSPTDADIVRTGDAPKCSVVDGHTVVHYSPSFHPSFKCTHDNGACTCTTHPTSALGGCMEIDHTNGDTVQHGGDCITQDKKWKYMFQGSCDRSGPWGNGKQLWVLAASDGSTAHLIPAGSPLNPGTTPAERAQACGDACLAKATPIVKWSWSQNTWDGFTAKGFMVAEDAAAGGAGECWCQQAPSDPCRGMIEQNGQWVNQMPNRDYWRIASAPDAMSWLQGAARYDFT